PHAVCGTVCGNVLCLALGRVPGGLYLESVLTEDGRREVVVAIGIRRDRRGRSGGEGNRNPRSDDGRPAGVLHVPFELRRRDRGRGHLVRMVRELPLTVRDQ